MALLSALHGDGSSDALCSMAHAGSFLTGMTAMYALMSLFHSPPWFRLIGGAR
jgi:hypothetical protein